MVWCFVRYFIPTSAGRKRFNVLGVVDALTKEIIPVVNETTVNAETVCQLLSKLAAHVSEGAITVVFDNVRYQKCALVQDCAAALGDRTAVFAFILTASEPDRAAVAVCAQGVFVFALLCKLSRVSGRTGDVADHRPPGALERIGNAPGLEFSMAAMRPRSRSQATPARRSLLPRPILQYREAHTTLHFLLIPVEAHDIVGKKSSRHRGHPNSEKAHNIAGMV